MSLEVLYDWVLVIVNSSLSEVLVPLPLNEALVCLLLKTSLLEPTTFISNLPFRGRWLKSWFHDNVRGPWTFNKLVAEQLVSKSSPYFIILYGMFWGNDLERPWEGVRWDEEMLPREQSVKKANSSQLQYRQKKKHRKEIILSRVLLKQSYNIIKLAHLIMIPVLSMWEGW